MAERNDDLYSTLMDISDTIREKALDLTLNVNDESEESRDLLDRGKALQKAMRKKGKPTIKEASRKDDIEIAFCIMNRSHQGSYKKAGPYFEVSLKKTDFYEDVLSKASSTLELKKDVKSLVIVRASGVVIPDEKMKFGKSSCKWTIGRYLNKLHISPDKLNLGIGLRIDHTDYGDNETSIKEVQSPVSIDEDDCFEIPARKKPAFTDDEDSFAAKSNDKKKSTSDSSSSHALRPYRGSYLSPTNDVPFVEIHPPPVLEVKHKELKEATNNFDQRLIIGEGGFGVVYKGHNFRSAGTTVAIKVLNKEGIVALKISAELQLEAEVFALTKFRHSNVVDMMGYACDDDMSAIVYAYMPNGSLYDKLHKEKGVALSWAIRRQILIDSCRGLAFLHASTPPLVHQDIKSSNILLDDHFTAKISDFGFALHLPQVQQNKTMVTAPLIARTEGYFPPEITSGKFSDKSDVYSYGVVALETYTGLLAYKDSRSDPKLTELTEDDRQTAEGLGSISDKDLPPPELSFTHEVFEVVSKCLRRHSKRPKSAEVLQLWERSCETPTPLT